MNTIVTRKGKCVQVISQRELREPVVRGEYVRAFCHIHGSDHQRSLSIHRASGWGHCFNANCNATVMVEEWNPALAAHLLHSENSYAGVKAFPQPAHVRLPLALQPVLLHIPPQTQPWQRQELETLVSIEEHMRAALRNSRRARAYLEERNIPLEIALEAGVGYLPPTFVPRFRRQEQRSLMRRWAARIIFPLTSPILQYPETGKSNWPGDEAQGKGYIGRSLWRWGPGMKEDTHKLLLDQSGEVKRWIKTNPAEWFGSRREQMARRIIVVEGAFDRLTLMTAGFAASEVVALAGTAMQLEWLPPQVKTLILALDGDEGGSTAADRLREQCLQEGFHVQVCPSPMDRWGKDWNERWQHIGQESIWPLKETCSFLRSA